MPVLPWGWAPFLTPSRPWVLTPRAGAGGFEVGTGLRAAAFLCPAPAGVCAAAVRPQRDARGSFWAALPGGAAAYRLRCGVHHTSPGRRFLLRTVRAACR